MDLLKALYIFFYTLYSSTFFLCLRSWSQRWRYDSLFTLLLRRGAPLFFLPLRLLVLIFLLEERHPHSSACGPGDRLHLALATHTFALLRNYFLLWRPQTDLSKSGLHGISQKSLLC